MTSKHRLFRAFYRLGITPWDGHPLAQSLRHLVEANTPAAGSTALDLGCGTGDISIYLAKHGWQVTGVDFVPKALDKARAKAAAQQVPVTFVQADVTRLSSSAIGAGFALIVDNGCLHNMSDDDRVVYPQEVAAVAAPDALLLVVALTPGSRLGVRGIEQAEIERRFTPSWTLLSSGDELSLARNGKNSGRYYLFQRRQ